MRNTPPLSPNKLTADAMRFRPSPARNANGGGESPLKQFGHVLASVLAVLLCVAAAAIAYLPAGMRGEAYITCAISLSVVAIASVWHLRPRVRAIDEQSLTRTLLVAGVLCRVVLVATPSYTSHDVQRYLWDGAVLAAGHDPWTEVRANLPELAAQWPAPAEHAHLPTLYPPLSVALFAALSLLGPSGAWLCWKLLALTASLALLFATQRLLHALRRSDLLPLIAFAPLPILEAGVGGHLDILCAALVAFSLLAFREDRPVRAALLIGLAGALKLGPLAALLPLLIATARKRRLAALGAGSTPVIAAYAAAFVFGARPPGSLLYFFQHWHFGSPLFALVLRFVDDPAPIVGAPLTLLLLGISCWLARRDVIAATGLALLAPLIASPVVFPWYLLSLAAPAAARPSRLLWAWMSLAPLTYEVLDPFDLGRGWTPASWPLWVLAAGCFIGAASDLLVFFRVEPKLTSAADST